MSASDRRIQRAINDSASCGPWALLDFLQDHAIEQFEGWSPYNLCAALHKVVGLLRSRAGCGLSKELQQAGHDLGHAATRRKRDLDFRQIGNMLLDLRLLEQWAEICSLSSELLTRVETSMVQFSAWDLTNALSGRAAEELLGDRTLRRVFQPATRQMAKCDASYWSQWKAKDIANTAFAIG